MKSQITAYVILLFALLSLLCCNNRQVDVNPNEFYIGAFDVSNDDQKLIFSLYHMQQVWVYQMNIDGKEFKPILTPTKDSLFFAPKFIMDDTKIIFIGKRKDTSRNTAIYISNADGSDRQRITNGKEMIDEAVYSECEDKIYYSRANTFGHYSPLASNAPHGMDVYSLNIKTKAIENVTNMNAYGIFGLSEYDCNNLLFYMPVQDEGGMILFPKDKTLKFSRLNPANNPSGMLSLYYESVYSKEYNMLAFNAPHELYIMDMKSKNAALVFRNIGETQLNYLRLFHQQKKLVFTVKDERNFNIINFDGKGLQTIILPVDSTTVLPHSY